MKEFKITLTEEQAQAAIDSLWYDICELRKIKEGLKDPAIDSLISKRQDAFDALKEVTKLKANT